MKLFSLAAAAVLMMGSPAVSQNLKTTPSAAFLNIEAPFRCSVKEFGDIDISSTISLKEKDFKLNYIDEMDKLPRFEVNGFTFSNQALDEVIQKLVDEAGIEVYSEDIAYPELNGKDIYGELTNVVAELSKAGDSFYKYDAKRKYLYLSHKGRFELQVPNNRLVMFAMLDALRGADITDAIPNWKSNTISMTLSREGEKVVQELVDYILQDSKLLLADIQLYRLTPIKQGSNWQEIVNDFGAGRIYTAQKGVVGKMLSMGHQRHSEHLKASLGLGYNVTKISQGVAVVPHGWKMRFDLGRCAPNISDVSSLSILLNANIKTPESIDTEITVDTQMGEITTFDVITAMDNELAIIGVPAFEGKTGMNDELLFTLKLRFIRFVK
jgi:hypothetical protein